MKKSNFNLMPSLSFVNTSKEGVMTEGFRKKWIANWKRRIAAMSIDELEEIKASKLSNIKQFKSYIKAAEWNIDQIEKVIKEKSSRKVT